MTRAHSVRAARGTSLQGDTLRPAASFLGDRGDFQFKCPQKREDSCMCGILRENTKHHEGRKKCEEMRAWILSRNYGDPLPWELWDTTPPPSSHVLVYKWATRALDVCTKRLIHAR